MQDDFSLVSVEFQVLASYATDTVHRWSFQGRGDFQVLIQITSEALVEARITTIETPEQGLTIGWDIQIGCTNRP